MKKNEKGFSLVELLVVVIIIAIVAAIAIPNLLASRRAANESSAISTLRTYHSAEATYQATDGNSVAYTDSAGLAGLVDAVLSAATPQKSGYNFSVTTSGANDEFYCGTATPQTADSGRRAFSVGIDGVIYTSAVSVPPAIAVPPTCADGVVTGGTVVGGGPAT